MKTCMFNMTIMVLFVYSYMRSMKKGKKESGMEGGMLILPIKLSQKATLNYSHSRFCFYFHFFVCFYLLNTKNKDINRSKTLNMFYLGS